MRLPNVRRDGIEVSSFGTILNVATMTTGPVMRLLSLDRVSR
jgi:hypothetical protein